MPDKRDDDDTDSFWPWEPDAVSSPEPEQEPSAPRLPPEPSAPPLRPEPSAPEPSAPPPLLPPQERSAAELARLPRPVRRPPAASRGRSVVPHDKPPRERPSLGELHGRRRALDAGLLLLAVVVIVLAVLALQG